MTDFISYLSGRQSSRDGIAVADGTKSYCTISSGSFSANTDYLIIFCLSYTANQPSYLMDVSLQVPSGTVLPRVATGTSKYKSFSGAIVVNSGATPIDCKFNVTIKTIQATGSVYVDDGIIIAIDMSTGLRVGEDIISNSVAGTGYTRGTNYLANDLVTATLPATSEPTDWLVLGTVMFGTSGTLDQKPIGLQLYNNTDAVALHTREETSGDSVANHGWGLDYYMLGGMALIEGNTAAKDLRLQCVGDNYWATSGGAQMIFLRLNRFRDLIIDQGDHGGAGYSGTSYNIVPMNGQSLAASGTQGQIYLWAATLNASAGSGADFETKGGPTGSVRLSLGSPYLYSMELWRASDIFWVQVVNHEQTVTTMKPSTTAVSRLGGNSAGLYKGVAFGTPLSPILMDTVDLDMWIGQTFTETADVGVLVAATREPVSDLDVMIAETRLVSTGLDMSISLVETVWTNLDLLIAKTLQVDTDFDVHLTGVEYISSLINILVAATYETDPVDIDMAIGINYTLSAGMDLAVSDSPHMVIEPDRPKYMADIEVSDFETTASPNGWYSPTKDFAALGVAKRDVVEIQGGMNVGSYIVREVQGHALLVEEFIRTSEQGPILGAVRKERNLTAQFNAAVVMDQPMFMPGKSMFSLLDMLIQ